MDDALETPRPRAEKNQEADDHSSGDEDGGLDWAKLPKFGAAIRPIIPKRGEKDFEPAHNGGSGLQLHVLDRSREAMFEALRTNRAISSKNISYGIWYPSIDRVHVTTARGIHFSTMGYSISRTAQYDNIDNESRVVSSKQPKRLELLPEEALYLIERGALFCYKSISDGKSLVDPSDYETKSPGAPMSVQQAFAEMIGCEGTTMERYQVYAYLKRLGFTLTRAGPPTPEYPVTTPVSLAATPKQTIARRIAQLFSHSILSVISTFRIFCNLNSWSQLHLRRLKTTQDMFRALQFIPCGHTVPLYHPVARLKLPSKSPTPSPYKVFFHVYKPSTSFRKTAPPPADFYLVVVDARTTPIPSLRDLTALFNVLPDMPLPPPRKRGIQASNRQPSGSQPTDVRSTTPTAAPRKGALAKSTPSQPRPSLSSVVWTLIRRLLSFPPSFRTDTPKKGTKLPLAAPKPNPFLALKTGKKTIVIAAVDAGNISFFRFGQGAFEEWPMI